MSAEAEERFPFAIDSCHTIVRIHCCEVFRSAAWFSVQFRYVGKASTSCCCSMASHAVEQPERVLFQRPTKLSSNGRYSLTRWMKPWMATVSAGSSSGTGSSMVACNVSGRRPCKAKALNLSQQIDDFNLAGQQLRTSPSRKGAKTDAFSSSTRSDHRSCSYSHLASQEFAPAWWPLEDGTMRC